MSRPTGSAGPAATEPHPRWIDAACGSTRRRRPVGGYVPKVTVLEVGPDGVRVLGDQVGPVGPPVDPGLVEAALEWIDDPVGLYDERPVAVADLWRTVIAAVVGPRCDSVVLVHPDDWSPRRIARVVAAANAVADQVAPTRRSDWGPEAGGEQADEPPARRRGGRRFIGPAVGAVLVVTAVAGFSTRPPSPDPAAAADLTTVVEGRVAVQFPRSWSIARVTRGPGSRRLQASSPTDPDLAVHVTQSYTPQSTLTQAAAVLREAIEEQPVGVFLDFDPDATVGELPALTYREIRPGRVIEWMVLLIGSTRLAVGCQSPPGRTGEVRPICVQVATSALENGTEESRRDRRDLG